MTLERRLRDIERRIGGRTLEPRDMSSAELWACLLGGVRDAPDTVMEEATTVLEGVVEAGDRASPGWEDKMLRLVGPYVPELAATAAQMEHRHARS